MARSTEQLIRDAFNHYAEHPERLDYPIGATETDQLRTTDRRRHWVPVAAFVAVAATVVAVLILIPWHNNDNRDDAAVVAPPASTVGGTSAPSTATTAVGTSPAVSSPTRTGAAVRVPNVVGLTEAQAREVLTTAGVSMRKTTAPSEEAVRDLAIAQSPATGGIVQPGATITVTFGAGPEMVVIPDGLVGMSLEQARQALAEAGLTVTDKADDSPEPRGQVLSITVPDSSTWVSGRAISKGATVRVTWSNNSQFIMPNLTQMDPGSAAKALEKAGWQGDVEALKDAATARPTTEPTQVGLILSQSQRVGSAVDKSARVTVDLGTIQLIYVPELTGLTVDQAEETLRTLGWRGDLQLNGDTPLGPPDQAGTIASQRPRSGSQITILDNVAVSVYAK